VARWQPPLFRSPALLRADAYTLCPALPCAHSRALDTAAISALCHALSIAINLALYTRYLRRAIRPASRVASRGHRCPIMGAIKTLTPRSIMRYLSRTYLRDACA